MTHFTLSGRTIHDPCLPEKSGRRLPSSHAKVSSGACYGPDYSRSPVKFSSSWKMLMKFR